MKNSEQPAHATLYYDEQTGKPNGHSIGLTKREYFAGLAMQGLLSYEYNSTINISRMAIEYSDEILKQLELTKTETK